MGMINENMATKNPRKKWSDKDIAQGIVDVHRETGVFPTVSLLKARGQNDLACAIVRGGGFMEWANRLGMEREASCSDMGWDGEMKVMQILAERWPNVTRPTAVKCPFDLLVNGVLRIDVKTAKIAMYGSCTGWFYRIGKMPQADIVALYQSDNGHVYWIPWHQVPASTVTISAGGGIYRKYRDNIELVESMLKTREQEAAQFAVRN